MGDIFIILSTIAAALALYHRIRANQSCRRLLKLLEEQREKEADHEEAP